MTGFLPSKTIQMQHLEVPNKKKPSPQPSLPIDINKTIGLFLNIGVVMAGDILFTIFLWLWLVHLVVYYTFNKRGCKYL